MDVPELEACVHCGFCLPACPTYIRLGDEADSPRGRLYLMRAVVDGRIDPSADAFQTHIDRCLGCRACEPVCPSGVPYGALLEQARAMASRHRRAPWSTRVLLWVFRTPGRTRPVLALGRFVRDLGFARGLAKRLSKRGAWGSLRRGLLMLAGTSPWQADRIGGGSDEPAVAAGGAPVGTDSPPETVGILVGCVQQHLFARVGEATAGVLRVNHFAVRAVSGQGCCGAIHAHAGDLEGARRLARANIEAFESAGVDRIAVDAAGCGAALREYGAWLAADPRWRARAEAVAAAVADVTELLAERGPRTGGEIRGSVAYHPPCHLEHAHGVTEAPRKVLGSIPGLEVRTAERASECCGGAGIYGLTHPDLGGRIGADKARALVDTEADCVATGNPGCMMQIAAFLHDEQSQMQMTHPVELLYESYRRAGLVPPRTAEDR